MSDSATPQPPAIAVIIATHNRGDLMTRHLQALAAQAVSPDAFEVVVVDDGSTDDTMARLAAFAATSPFRFTYASQQNAGAGAARNSALARTAAPLVLFSNDDTLPEPGLIAAHLAFHAAHPDVHWGAVGAVSLAPEFRSTPFTQLHHAQWESLRSGDDLPFTAFITANISVKRVMLQEHGGFTPDLRWHEDAELGLRLQRGGLRLRFLPEARAYHHHAIDEREMRRMAQRDGRQLVEWYRREPEALPDLEHLGLAGPPPFRRTLRQKLSAAVVSDTTASLVAAAARAAAPIAPAASVRLWRVIFTYEKRQAIVEALQRAS